MSGSRSYIGVVRDIVTHDKKTGESLNDPYAVVYCDEIVDKLGNKEPVTFAIRLLFEPGDLEIGDEVHMSKVKRKHIRIKGKWGHGWRAKEVRSVSPSSQEENEAEKESVVQA